MKRLKVTFPSNLTIQEEALRTEIYWEQFENCSIRSFESAVNGAIKNCGFFPKPSELHELIRLESENRYRERLSYRDQYKLEYKENFMTKEEAKECLKKINEMIKLKHNDPRLEGIEAEEFERKRLIAKEKAKEIIN